MDDFKFKIVLHNFRVLLKRMSNTLSTYGVSKLKCEMSANILSYV